MKTKAIPAPGQVESPAHDPTAAGPVAMVVMLVPIQAPPAAALQAQTEAAQSPTYVDSHDHVWLLVDKASPMAAMLQQITAAEPATIPAIGHVHSSHESSAAISVPLGSTAQADMAALPAEPLSRREIDVLRLMADGQSNQEIAQTLILAISTIKMHVKHIYGKLGVRNRVQAVAQARVRGLFTTAMH